MLQNRCITDIEGKGIELDSAVFKVQYYIPLMGLLQDQKGNLLGDEMLSSIEPAPNQKEKCNIWKVFIA